MSIAWKVRGKLDAETLRQGWEVRRVGDVVTLINGYPFSSDDFGPTGDIPLVRIRDLGNNPFETYVVGHIPPSVILRNGDVVIGMDGDFNLATWTRGKAALNQRLCALRPRPGIDMRFIAYALPMSLKIINDLTFSTTVKHLSSTDVLSERLLLPPLEEQRRIADFLDAETTRIDRLVAARVQQRASLEEHSYAEVSEVLLPGVLTAPGKNWPWVWLPELAADRPLVRLGYVCRLQNGLTVDSKRDVSGDSVTRPYLRVANVQAGYVDLTLVTEVTVPREIAERSTLRPGDVLMTEGGDLDKLGRGTVWNGELSDCLHQNHVFALRPEPDRLDANYLALMTQTLHGRCYFESTGSKTTNLASTNSSKILSFPIPLPYVNRQHELVQQVRGKLDIVTRARVELDRQLELLAERRQALITAAVTGQIDVSTASGRGIED